MNAPSPQIPSSPAGRLEDAETLAQEPSATAHASPAPALPGPIGCKQSAEAAAYGTSGGRETGEPIRNLFEACLRMLKLTGGSQYWTGDTQAALEFMEAAVAAALETGALRTPEPAPPAVVPGIVASFASSVDCTLHLAGIEAESRRAI